MKRTRAAVALAALAVGGLSLFSPAQASHSWGGYHWAKGSAPVALSLGDNVTSDWDPYLAQSSAGWTASAVLDTAVVPGATNPRRCNPVAGTVQVCNAKYGSTGWLGLAQIWLNNGHIGQGTSKMNDTYFSTARYNTADERAHVMCQEVGHTFGLGHTSEDGTSQGTCMDYSESPDSTQPNAHDYEQLDLVYGHTDGSTATVASGPSRGASGLDVSDRREWGQLVEKRGAHEVYVRDFGNGQKVVTFIVVAAG